jgi:hypothetical protein
MTIMLRIALAFALASLASPAWSQHEVDLDRPGALDRVARENPRHYREILAVTQVASNVSCSTPLGMMPVPAAAKGMDCEGLTLMTSYPAKRRVSFEIDNIRYRMIVTLADTPGGLMPVVK